MRKSRMRIGELARRTACSAETIRYYEREGLLPEPGRSTGNYRLYGETHLERLTFIRNCRALDMKHEEIRSLLGFKERGGRDCSQVDALLGAHISHVDSRITDLQILRKQLLLIKAACNRGQPVHKCGVLRRLAEKRIGSRAKCAESSHLDGTHSARAKRPSLRKPLDL